MSKLPKLPPLKKWTKQSLSKTDWNFSELCDALEKAKSELKSRLALHLSRTAFDWEIERELGSGNGPFDLTKELRTVGYSQYRDREGHFVLTRKDHPPVAVVFREPSVPETVSKRTEAVHEWHFAELSQYLPPDIVSIEFANSDLCVLEIPRLDDEKDIVSAFRRWLRKHRGPRPMKPGAPIAWRTRFRDLAIYRLSVAGYARDEVLEELRISNMDSTVFYHAKGKTRKEILRRYDELRSRAQWCADEFPTGSVPNWRSFFTTQLFVNPSNPRMLTNKCQKSAC